MNNLKPTIVFVTGAWHKPELYSPLLDNLRNHGYTVLAPHLPSVGGSMDSFDEDVSLVRTTIQDAISQKAQEIAVIMHSYGGVVGSAAVKGLAKHDTKTDGGVTKMIYMAAFALDEGVSLNGIRGGPLPPWCEVVNNDKQLKAHENKHVFYNDVQDSIAQSSSEQLLYQSKGSFDSKQIYAAWKHIDSTYIVCELDNAIPVVAQDAMTSQPGAKFEVVRLHSGHSPFLSMTQKTTDVVRKALGEKL